MRNNTLEHQKHITTSKLTYILADRDWKSCFRIHWIWVTFIYFQGLYQRVTTNSLWQNLSLSLLPHAHEHLQTLNQHFPRLANRTVCGNTTPTTGTRNYVSPSFSFQSIHSHWTCCAIQRLLEILIISMPSIIWVPNITFSRSSQLKLFARTVRSINHGGFDLLMAWK